MKKYILFAFLVFVGFAKANAQSQVVDHENTSTITYMSEVKNIQVNGITSCAFELTYAKAIRFPATWNGEKCEQLTLAFVSLSDLENMGKISKISDETRQDISSTADGKVLYIEGQFTSAIYPLNVFKRGYRVYIAD